MPLNTEVSAFGTKLWVDSTKTAAYAGTFAQVANIEEGTLPEVNKDTYEAKVLDQSSRAKEFRSTYYDGGELSFKIVFKHTIYGSLLTYAKDPDAYPFRITLNDDASDASRSKIEFQGIVTKLSVPLSAGGERLVCDITLKVTGDMTWTAHA